MAILSREDFFARLQARIGTETSDESITFLEDMTDTYNDLERRANGDGIDWERKYHELNESWKKKYTHRFFSGGDRATPNMGQASAPDNEPDSSDITVADLFTEENK